MQYPHLGTAPWIKLLHVLHMLNLHKDEGIYDEQYLYMSDDKKISL
jgi:hypothetical protein